MVRVADRRRLYTVFSTSLLLTFSLPEGPTRNYVNSDCTASFNFRGTDSTRYLFGTTHLVPYRYWYQVQNFHMNSFFFVITSTVPVQGTLRPYLVPVPTYTIDE